MANGEASRRWTPSNEELKVPGSARCALPCHLPGDRWSVEAGTRHARFARLEVFCGDPRHDRSEDTASQNVARKLGFTFWKQAIVDGFRDNLYRLQVGAARTTRADP
jgi:hypothetical protein